MNRSLFCIANNIPTHFSNELVLHSKVKSYLLLRDTLDCYPQSFVLPEELDSFLACKDQEELWILKEDMVDRGIEFLYFSTPKGEGVFVFHRDGPIPPYISERVVVQKYVANPMLCENKKWGFRTVVLCEGTRKIPIFILQTGGCKLKRVHYVWKSHHEGHEVITRDWVFIKENIIKEREEEVLEKCKDIIKSCLNALELTEEDKRGYAMFAFDFLLDEDFGVWLIEINSSPGNMAMSSRMRYPDTPLLVEEVGQLMIDCKHLGKERTSFKFTVIQDGLSFNPQQ